MHQRIEDVRSLISEAILHALAYAQRTRDTYPLSRLLQLLEPLGSEKRWDYVGIIRKTSPLRPAKVSYGISTKFEKPQEREFDLVQAARCLGLGERPPEGFPCERWTRQESEMKLKEIGLHLSLGSPFSAGPILLDACNISNLDPAELLFAFCSSVPIALGSDSAQSAEAKRIIDTLDSEWARRTKLQCFFVWPPSYVRPGSGTLGGIESPKRGIFSALGYRVGKMHGQTTEVRRFILDYIYSRTLPPLNGPLYMRKWDDPTTPRRLRAMAYFVARTSWNAQRRIGRDFGLAISQWSEDLEYLRQQYYKGPFRWP